MIRPNGSILTLTTQLLSCRSNLAMTLFQSPVTTPLFTIKTRTTSRFVTSDSKLVPFGLVLAIPRWVDVVDLTDEDDCPMTGRAPA
jgi:hypothetical protein